MTMTNTNTHERKTWLVIGASRGIGREFVAQLLRREDVGSIVGTVRDVQKYEGVLRGLVKSAGAGEGGSGSGSGDRGGRGEKKLLVLRCDVSSEESIKVGHVLSCS